MPDSDRDYGSREMYTCRGCGKRIWSLEFDAYCLGCSGLLPRPSVVISESPRSAPDNDDWPEPDERERGEE